MTGQMIANRYKLVGSLGKGSFGEVFHAEDIKFDPPRHVAIKLLHPQFLGEPEVRNDIKREASALARFNHPNILRVNDFEITEELAFIVTDLAHTTLANLLRPDPTQPPVTLPLPQILNYLEQLANGLDEAHANGVIHRDLKPQNVLIAKDGRLMLADFGLAAVAGSASLINTNSSGTPLYMSPEQWQGQAGKASDIYALGVILYQMLTGSPPFLGNVSALMGQHLHAPVPKLQERASDRAYPAQLDQILAQAMAKEPVQRPKPAAELYRRFKAALETVPDQTAPEVTIAITIPTAPPSPVKTEAGLIYVGGGISLPDPRPNYKFAAPGRKGGTLRLASTSEPNSFFPYGSSGATDWQWFFFLYAAFLTKSDNRTTFFKF